MDNEPGVVTKKVCADGSETKILIVDAFRGLPMSSEVSSSQRKYGVTQADSPSPASVNVRVPGANNPPSQTRKHPKDPLRGPLVKVKHNCDTTDETGKHVAADLLPTDSEDGVMFTEQCEEEVVDLEHNVPVDTFISCHSVVKEESDDPSEPDSGSLQDLRNISGPLVKEELDCYITEEIGQQASTDLVSTNSENVILFKEESFEEEEVYPEHDMTETPEGESPASTSYNAECSRPGLRSDHPKILWYTCSTCLSEFTTSYLLKKHIRRNHSVGEFSCEVCDAKFRNQENLSRHAKIHSGIKPYCCHICGSKFTLAHVLKRHIRTHTKEKPYTCDLCGAKFAESGNLRTHQKTHTGEKPYACDFCTLRFSRKNLLQNHVRVHTGEKPFSCPECDASFTQKVHLTSHLRQHTKEAVASKNPYTCDSCFLRFPSKARLRIHARVHSGPYFCPKCDAGFAQKGHLNSHLRTHARVKPYHCEVCPA